MVFVYEDYYPIGGICDCDFTCDHFHDALDFALNTIKNKRYDPNINVQIFDLDERRIVYDRIDMLLPTSFESTPN